MAKCRWKRRRSGRIDSPVLLPNAAGSSNCRRSARCLTPCSSSLTNTTWSAWESGTTAGKTRIFKSAYFGIPGFRLKSATSLSSAATLSTTLDRFIAGEDVLEKEVQHVWRDTTESPVAVDSPACEDVLNEVRSVIIYLTAIAIRNLNTLWWRGRMAPGALEWRFLGTKRRIYFGLPGDASALCESQCRLVHQCRTSSSPALLLSTAPRPGVLDRGAR
jgi:hypothetical protein